MTSNADSRSMDSARSRRCLNSLTIASIVARDVAPVKAARAACCESVAAFDVVCDCRAVMLRVSAAGATDHPMRHPVIANDFATPSTTTSVSRSGATESIDVAGPL